jgi:hypothetical protein
LVEGFIRIVTTLYPYVGLDGSQKLFSSEIVENNHLIYRFQSGQDDGSVFLGVDGSIGAFKLPDGAVTVDANDQDVAKLAGLAQVGDVASVQDVEAAVGGHNALSDLTMILTPDRQRVGTYDLRIHPVIVYDHPLSSTELF